MNGDVDEVEVLVAHHERATVRAGGTFLKIDTDRARADGEVAAMAIAPIPTPRVLWREHPVLALATVPGTAIAHLGTPSTAPPAAWVAAGAVVRRLHDAPVPSWPAKDHHDIAAELDDACDWIVAHDVLPAELVRRNRGIAGVALRPWIPAFTHGDLQSDHVFVLADRVTGVIDWSEAGPGDPLYDLATLTIGHPGRLDDVLTGYGTDVDTDVIRAWWSLRSLLGVRWLIEHGYDPFIEGCEVDVLRSRP